MRPMRCMDGASDTQPTRGITAQPKGTMTHNIITVEPLKVGPQQRKVWHQITCGCGWTRRYVSEYRARCMHQRHTQEASGT
jgi:hypothetical protein